MLNIKKFGAVADGVTVNTAAIQNAIDTAAKTGETLLVPSGVFVTGTLNLKGVSLHLESHAVLKGSSDINDYPVQDYVHNEMGPLRAMLVDYNSTGVVIDGMGTIDFSGTAFYDTSKMNVPKSRVPYTKEQEAECTYFISQRPNQSLFFLNGKNIVVKDITLIDSPCWTMGFCDCENVKVLGLTITTSRNVPNDDGMHFSSCKGVLVSDCYIVSGDDCIALSGITNWGRPCEDVVINNCVMCCSSKAVVLGYLHSVVRNVLITNCIIKDSNRGFCFMCDEEGALIENVRITNCIVDTRVCGGNWWGNGEPILMMAVKHHSNIPAEQNPHHPYKTVMRNICFDNITCMGENAIGVYGTNGNIREVELRNIDFTKKPSKNIMLKGNRFDFEPGRVEFDIPEDCGVYVGGGAEVKLENINTRQWKVVRE